MTVLELDRPLARTPPRVPRRALHQPPPRGDAARAVVGGSPTTGAGRETAAEAAARLVAAHVPKVVAIGEEVPSSRDTAVWEATSDWQAWAACTPAGPTP